MKSYIFAGLLFLSSISSLAQPIDVLTFNIRYASFDAGPQNWNDRREGVISVIKGHDFVGLQEVVPIQMEDINLELFDEYGVLFRTRDEDPLTGEGSPVLYNKKRYELSGGGFFWLSDTPEVPGSNTWGAAFTRMASYGYFRDIFSGDSILVVNTHFDHISQAAREKSVDLIIRKFKDSADQMPVILMGDLNVAPDNSVRLKILSETSLSDSWATMHTVGQSTGASFHGWEPGEPKERIDYIFYSPLLEVEKSEVLHTAFGGNYPSDHFPVNSVLKIRSKP